MVTYSRGNPGIGSFFWGVSPFFETRTGLPSGSIKRRALQFSTFPLGPGFGAVATLDLI